ncbi:MAG: aminopeptidase P family N-terminal domain-containing protein, partial [Streptococcaceae bacterium]|nr:aminopeptidase P family N-terminal domain-containing protein [Streptococcaceae bacterium]
MSEKLTKLKRKMNEQGIEALLVMTPFNLRYITGFTGTAGLAIITQKENFFVTDSRYLEQAQKQVAGFTLVQNIGPILGEVLKIVETNGFENLAFEAGISYQQYMQLEELIPGQTDLFQAPGLIEDLRQIKTPEEIATIQKACGITDKAFEYILGKIKPGVTELELANELDFFMRKLGASGVSFE